MESILLPASAKQEEEEEDEIDDDDEDDDDGGGVKIQEPSREVERGVATTREWIPVWLSKHEQGYEEMVKWDTTAVDADSKANKETGVARVEGKAEGHGRGNESGRQKELLLPPRDKQKSVGTKGQEPESKEAKE